MNVDKKEWLQKSDRKREQVYVKECDYTFLMQTMCVRDQIQYEKELKDNKSEEKSVFGLIKRVCINMDGTPFFDNADLELLSQKSTTTVMALFKECLRVNSVDHLDVETMAKNS